MLKQMNDDNCMIDMCTINTLTYVHMLYNINLQADASHIFM